MVSTRTLLKKVLNVKDIVVTGTMLYKDVFNRQCLDIEARPVACKRNRCPYCGRKCSGYDRAGRGYNIWRSLDFGGTIVYIKARTNRVQCPEHGVVTASVPWAYAGSRFTKDFDQTAAWLATELSRKAVSRYMIIDWATVGNCISRTLNDIEPYRQKRLDNLVRIGIDETSYKKGHKYITVVINHDTNTVVWAAEGKGKEVLEKFYKSLTEEQRNSIRVTTSDAANWIEECIKTYTPNSVRCMDLFHVVQWVTDGLNEVRNEARQEAYQEYQRRKKEHPRKVGHPAKNDTISQAITEARKETTEIKQAKYALGKNPEHLTETQQIQLSMIAERHPKLYAAYLLKEDLRLILKIKDPRVAETELNNWIQRAANSATEQFQKISETIRKEKQRIINAIREQMNNARIEAINNKIKLIIRRTYGFRNIENLLDTVYLICSNLVIPLPNR